MNLIFLLLPCFSAGLVDSVVGGGGLIQVPALMVFQPQMAVAMLLGTNKSLFNLMGSYTGTFLANRHGVAFVRKFFIVATSALFVVLWIRW